MKNSKLALIGCGYWGRNYINILRDLGTASLDYVCDLNNKSFEPFVKKFPETKFINNYEQILNEGKIDGVIISTTASTHYKIAKDFLQKRIPLLIEKPLTIKSNEALEIAKISEDKKVPVLVGNIFMHNAALRQVKNLIYETNLGEIRYLESTRKGLGPIRKDVGALWDLATHDIYISCYLTNKLPFKVSSTGISHNGLVDDIVSLNMLFPGNEESDNIKNILSTVYANWEHPIKERKLYVGCTKGAILFDDIEQVNKITIYDKGVSYQPLSGEFSDFNASLRDGDIRIPKINNNNPLKDEVENFLSVLNSHYVEHNFVQGITSAMRGYEDVKILEAADLSRKQGGLEVALKW